MCKEINKLIKIIFVCIVYPRQHFPCQGKNKGQDGVQCYLEARLTHSGTHRESDPQSMLRGSLDGDLIFSTMLFFSSFPAPLRSVELETWWCQPCSCPNPAAGCDGGDCEERGAPLCHVPTGGTE